MLMYRQAATTPAEQELTQAVRRVLERYGSDLAAYFRHVQEVTNKNAAQEASTRDSVKGEIESDDQPATQS